MTMYDRALQSPSPSAAEADRSGLLLSRVNAELAAGFEALAGVERGVSVFGSARSVPGDPEYELARSVAARLGRQGFAIITGGGAGVMEAANRGAREVEALSIGLVIELSVQAPGNDYIDVPLRFEYFFTRKLMFVRYASAFVIFPGGLGTLDELFELAALFQRGKIRAPPIVLVASSYWRPLIEWLRGTVLDGGKISPSDLELFALADTVDEICAGVVAAAGNL